MSLEADPLSVYSFQAKKSPFLPSGIPDPNFCSRIYARIYALLRAQRTILDRKIEICSQQRKNTGFSSGESIEMSSIEEIVVSIQNSSFGSLFENVSQAISKLRTILMKPKIPEPTEKLGYSVLVPLLAIHRLSEYLSLSSVDSSISSPPPPRSIPSPTPPPIDPSQPSVMCRICERMVPISMIEEHCKSCQKAYQSSAAVQTIEERAKNLIESTIASDLSIPWPGPNELSIKKAIPAIHSILLLKMAISVDPTASSESTDQLSQIFNELQMIRNCQTNAAPFIDKASDLVSEKFYAALSLNDNKKIARRTSVPSDKEVSAQVSITDFHVIKRISSGAHAIVYLAKKNSTSDFYAIKVIPKENRSHKNQIKDVLNEKNIMYRLRSPYMISFYYSFLSSKYLYIVMEYLPGGDLYSLLQQLGSISEENAKKYTAQITAALELLRKHNIIHRDLKPDNILCDRDGRLKLADFGLSAYGVTDRSIIDSAKFSPVGTPDYISPELLLSMPHTFAADYWSLGVIVYELLIGVPPFHDETETETFSKILKGSYNTECLGDFSNECKDFISKLLEGDPQNRLGYGSIEEIKKHPWMNGIQWERLEEMTPPFVPQLSSPEDTSYFVTRGKQLEEADSDIFTDANLPPINSGTELDREIEEFPSVSFDNLSDVNLRVVKKISPSNFSFCESKGTKLEVSERNMNESKSFGSIPNEKKLITSRHCHLARTVSRGINEMTPPSKLAN